MDWKNLGNTILEKIKTTKILGIIGLVLMYIGLMVPFIKLDFFGTFAYVDKYLYDNGKGVLLLWFLMVLIMFSDVIVVNCPKGEKIISYLKSQKIILILCIIALIVLIITTVSMIDDYEDMFSLCPGYFLSWIGLIATAAYSILYKGKPKDYFDDDEDEE